MGFLIDRLKNPKHQLLARIGIKLIQASIILYIIVMVYNIDQRNQNCQYAVLSNPSLFPHYNTTCPIQCCGYYEIMCFNTTLRDDYLESVANSRKELNTQVLDENLFSGNDSFNFTFIP